MIIYYFTYYCIIPTIIFTIPMSEMRMIRKR